MRLLHTMLRVGNLDRSIAFYTEVLGMTLLRRKENAEGRFTLAFVGYGNEAENAVLELTCNWDIDHYDLGVYKACEQIKAAGGNVVRAAGPMKHGTRILAFVEDPDGYRIELLSGTTQG